MQKTPKKEQYTKKYYTQANYKHYLEKAEKYHRTAEEIHELLTKLSLLSKSSIIIDYGCAIGFLMEGFRQIGYRSIFGYDISKYATQTAREKGLLIMDKIINIKPNLLIALDVFEHMQDAEITDVLTKLDAKTMIARIPCAADNEDNFFLSVSKKDKAHINCKDKEEWQKLFLKLGFTTYLRLKLFSIYDTPGVFSFLALKT